MSYILHNALCLWRIYIPLNKTLGNKVVNYEATGINSMNPMAVSHGFTADREPEIWNSVSNPRPQDDTLEHIATSWGFNFVDIPGDGNCFFTAVAFHFHQLVSDSSSKSKIMRNHLQCI